MKRSILMAMARIRPELTRGVAACALLALPFSPEATIVDAHRTGASASPGQEWELRYTVRFQGVGAEGIDNIWRGPLGAATPGEITMRVEYRGAPMDVSLPVWRVRAMTFVAADDPTKSFLAESVGILDWSTGAMRLTGHVSEGWMKGTSVEQTLRLDRTQFDGDGSLRLTVVTASR